MRPCFLLLTIAVSLFTQLSALQFDYIIIGGGTSGLVVANRLSELPNITVAVIEAGGAVYNNPNVTDVDKFTLALGTDIDWNYESVSQEHADGRTIAFHGGKALGGTSTINGMTYIRAEKSQIDSWETLGNEGWNWNKLLPYYEKAEHFVVPTAAQDEAGASYLPSYHGKHGPLKVGYPYGLLNGSLVDGVEAAWHTLGISHISDANGGHVRGFTVWQSTLDRDANIREDAARAYYYPVQRRPNLHVFLNTTANKIIWESSISVVANGVEIASQNGTVSILRAKKEVIISAGSLRSPAILELSGIGNPSILSKLRIPIKVSLPGVGENLQDQPLTGLTLQGNTTFNGTTSYATFGLLSDIFPTVPSSNITGWAAVVSASMNNSLGVSALTHLFRIQYDLLSKGVPDAETIIGTTATYGLGPSGYLSSAFWLLMPFSRGNVHISSANASVHPEINPNFFVVDYDLKVQIAIAKWTRKFWNTKPMRAMVTEVSPGFQIVPRNASDKVWGEWVKSSFSSNSHPLGTASMMSRHLGGVVDKRLKVYGTKNVRVVDASIMPLQVSGHLTSTLYAIAEKAADMIKEDVKYEFPSFNQSRVDRVKIFK